MCLCVRLSVHHSEVLCHLPCTMTSTAELFTTVTSRSEEVALQKYLPELSKVALRKVRVLVVLRLTITEETLT